MSWLIAFLSRLWHAIRPGVSQPAAKSPYTVYLPVLMQGTPQRGIALSDWREDDLYNVGACWWYGWYPRPHVYPGIESVPMIAMPEQVEDQVSGSSIWLMGFNEPDQVAQANISTTEAVPLWHRIEERFPDKKLVAPCPSDLNPDWLPQFRARYIETYGAAPRFDALAVHAYRWSAREAMDLVWAMMCQASTWGIAEVWVSEFAFLPWGVRSDQDAAYELTRFIAWLRQQTRVSRWAYFTNRAYPQNGERAPLFDGDGLTAYGQAYRAA